LKMLKKRITENYDETIKRRNEKKGSVTNVEKTKASKEIPRKSSHIIDHWLPAIEPL